MTIEALQPAPAATWIGQATAVEQARAVAEVAAAVQVAKMFPRNIVAAQADMRRACSRFAMADRAFYNFRRGGQNVNGPTVYLARELARCFGNLQWGIVELRRDEAGGTSEMQAFAWDVENNSRQSTTFVVPHARDVDGEIKPLSTLRDVYENNANQGARRQREMILGLLPQWFVDEAVDLCRAALRKGEGDKSLDQRIAAAVEGFGSVFRIDRARLERRVGAPISAWSEQDVADIGIVFRSLERGELTVAEAFPTASVTVADLGPAPAEQPPAAPAASAAAKAPGAAAAAAGTGPGRAADAAGGAPALAPLSTRTWAKINARFVQLAVTGDGQSAKRRDVMCRILDRQVTKPDDLTETDGETILANLADPTGAKIVAEVTGIGAVVEEQPAPDDSGEQRAPVADPDAVTVSHPWPGDEQAPAEPVPSPDEIDPTVGDDWPASSQDFTEDERQ